MKSEYQKWIQKYPGDIFRKCKEVSIEMQGVFPELRIAKGLVQIIENSQWYQHQWLVDLEGAIVDPTANQWVGIIGYREIKEEDPKPIGKCMNCGGWVFSDTKSGTSMACSPECYNTIVNDMF